MPLIRIRMWVIDETRREFCMILISILTTRLQLTRKERVGFNQLAAVSKIFDICSLTMHASYDYRWEEWKVQILVDSKTYCKLNSEVYSGARVSNPSKTEYVKETNWLIEIFEEFFKNKLTCVNWLAVGQNVCSTTTNAC